MEIKRYTLAKQREILNRLRFGDGWFQADVPLTKEDVEYEYRKLFGSFHIALFLEKKTISMWGSHRNKNMSTSTSTADTRLWFSEVLPSDPRNEKGEVARLFDFRPE